MCSYSGGCRCDTCRTKQRDRMRKYVAERREREPDYQLGGGRATHSIVCPTCGTRAEVPKRNSFCSHACGNQPGAVVTQPRYRKRVRPPLVSAIRDGDLVAVCWHLLAQASVTALNCWEWPTLDERGYPQYLSTRGLHRAVLEVKHGASLGVQQAHHICANRKCVNPDHLQPVTHRDNVAEMMQRQTYLARIRELEQALADVAPDHPVLKTVPVL